RGERLPSWTSLSLHLIGGRARARAAPVPLPGMAGLWHSVLGGVVVGADRSGPVLQPGPGGRSSPGSPLHVSNLVARCQAFLNVCLSTGREWAELAPTWRWIISGS